MLVLNQLELMIQLEATKSLRYSINWNTKKKLPIASNGDDQKRKNLNVKERKALAVLVKGFDEG